MNQFGYPPGGAPAQWPVFPAAANPMAPQGYPAVAPSYPPAAAPGYPGAAPYPTPAVTPPGYPAAAPVAPRSMGPGGVPVFHIPDEEMVRAAYKEYQEEAAARGMTRAQYVKFPGPQGQTKWDASVYVGYSCSLTIYLLPAWGPGKNIHRRVRSHFYRSYQHPRGTSLNCPGPETCLICKSRDLAISSADLALQKKAKDYARTRTQYLYNVILLDNPAGHTDRSGQMRPFILGAGTTLHEAIQTFISERGLLNIVHPLNGRPLKITRKKTGPNDMDVEYSVVDLNPAPLHPYFYPALASLWDLDAEDKVTNPEQQLQAVQEIGLPIPAEAQSYGMPGAPAGYPPGYGPGVPPGYGAPGYGQAPGAPMAPVAPNPYPVGSPTAPVAMPPPALPGAYPPAYPSAAPSMPPPPTAGLAPPPPSMPPPMPTPPPVMSSPMPGPNPYAPQPSPGGGMAPPPPMAPPPAPSMLGAIPYPVPQGISLPGGRERCYGRFSGGDRYCQECPPELRVQCERIGQSAVPPAVPMGQPGMAAPPPPPPAAAPPQFSGMAAPPPPPPAAGPPQFSGMAAPPPPSPAAGPPQPGAPTLAALSNQLTGR